jgi:hypothetical protein
MQMARAVRAGGYATEMSPAGGGARHARPERPVRKESLIQADTRGFESRHLRA